MAELFTGDNAMDIKFTNILGLNALIREVRELFLSSTKHFTLKIGAQCQQCAAIQRENICVWWSTRRKSGWMHQRRQCPPTGAIVSLCHVHGCHAWQSSATRESLLMSLIYCLKMKNCHLLYFSSRSSTHCRWQPCSRWRQMGMVALVDLTSWQHLQQKLSMSSVATASSPLFDLEIDSI